MSGNSVYFRTQLKNNRIPSVIRIMPMAVDRAVRRTAFRVKAKALESMQGTKHGTIYHRNGVDHQASKDGEAPAIDTGALANSLETVHFEVGHAGVVAGAEYATFLEMGTRKMAPRPFLKPALNACWDYLMEALDRIWEEMG